MKKISVIIVMFLGMVLHAQQAVPIIPKPVSLAVQKGNFVLDKNTTFVNSSKDKAVDATINLFKEYVKKNNGIEFKTTKGKGTKVVFEIAKINTIGQEGYLLEANSNVIVIKANSAKGLFYGTQSLIQLLPTTKNAMIQIPCMQATDYPRFGWRGMMLDCSRHFFTTTEVKSLLDLLASYKMNKFHWHLTDDQGWRIEIKKYPKLTEIGSVRNGTIVGKYPGTGNDNKEVKGFYTQEEVKEIVAYAAARNIEIIPEIEMPGHSSAAIAAYPELSCFPNEITKFKDDKVANKTLEETKKGRLKFVVETFGVFEDVFAPTDYTFQFLENVIDEVLPLFPSKYIHIGGDECPKENWKRSEFCQNLIKKEGLKDEHGLQSYFIQRMEKYINGKGKKIIGWDEILEGGLAPNATVMSWRGEKGGIEAVKLGHDVVMTPGNPCYINRGQSDGNTEWGHNDNPNNTLKKVYAYEPIPAELGQNDEKYVLGSQVNVWTEYIPTYDALTHMVLPRMPAMAEVLWSPKGSKNWDDFYKRIQHQKEIYQSKGIEYSNGSILVAISYKEKGEAMEVTLEIENPKGSIVYTIDGSEPDVNSLKYEKPLVIEASTKLKAAMILDGKVVSYKVTVKDFQLDAATKKFTVK